MERKRLTPKERRIVFDKTNGHCAYCGCELELDNFQVDHVVSLNRYQWDKVRYGGDPKDVDTLDNMLPACRSCNFYKMTRTIEEFRREISAIPGRLERDKFIYKLALRYGIIEEHNTPVEFYFEKMAAGKNPEPKQSKKEEKPMTIFVTDERRECYLNVDQIIDILIYEIDGCTYMTIKATNDDALSLEYKSVEQAQMILKDTLEKIAIMQRGGKGFASIAIIPSTRGIEMREGE